MESNPIVKSDDKIMMSLRQNFREDVKSFSVLKPFYGFFLLAWDWGLICGTIYLAKSTETIFTTIFALFVVASRQHALLALTHEAVHYRLFKSRFWNDFVGNLFAAYPLVWDVYGYRENHVLHHKYVNTAQDPDWQRKLGHPDWQFSNSKKYLSRLFLRYLWGFGFVDNVKFALVMSNHWPAEKLKRAGQASIITGKFFYYSIVLGGLYYLGLGSTVVLYWFVPFFFIYPPFQKFRSIAEHFGLPNNHELNETRNVTSGSIESFFFSPHDLNYHLLHHLFPTIPCYNLKKLNKKFLQNSMYQELAFHNDSYILQSEHSVFSDLTASSSAVQRKTA